MIVSYAYDPVYSMASTQLPVTVYNNVAIGTITYGLRTSSGTTLVGSSTNTVTRNNIIVTASTTCDLIQSYSGANIDNNLYFGSGITHDGWYFNGTGYNTIADYTAASAQEAHGVYGNPLFRSGTPTLPPGFQLHEGSPAVNSGVNMKSAGFIDAGAVYVDWLGVGIPQGIAPDIGAFELTGLSHIGTLRAGSIRGR